MTIDDTKVVTSSNSVVPPSESEKMNKIDGNTFKQTTKNNHDDDKGNILINEESSSYYENMNKLTQDCKALQLQQKSMNDSPISSSSYQSSNGLAEINTKFTNNDNNNNNNQNMHAQNTKFNKILSEDHQSDISPASLATSTSFLSSSPCNLSTNSNSPTSDTNNSHSQKVSCLKESRPFQNQNYENQFTTPSKNNNNDNDHNNNGENTKITLDQRIHSSEMSEITNNNLTPINNQEFDRFVNVRKLSEDFGLDEDADKLHCSTTSSGSETDSDSTSTSSSSSEEDDEDSDSGDSNDREVNSINNRRRPSYQNSILDPQSKSFTPKNKQVSADFTNNNSNNINDNSFTESISLEPFFRSNGYNNIRESDHYELQSGTNNNNNNSSSFELYPEDNEDLETLKDFDLGFSGKDNNDENLLNGSSQINNNPDVRNDNFMNEERFGYHQSQNQNNYQTAVYNSNNQSRYNNNIEKRQNNNTYLPDQFQRHNNNNNNFQNKTLNSNSTYNHPRANSNTPTNGTRSYTPTNGFYNNQSIRQQQQGILVSNSQDGVRVKVYLELWFLIF